MRDKIVIKYWLTACHDTQREHGGCRECHMEEDCKRVRSEMFGSNVLRKRRFTAKGVKIKKSVFMRIRTVEVEETIETVTSPAKQSELALIAEQK